jgi:hypothetical protein
MNMCAEMSNQEKYDFAMQKLKDFKNYIEIADFRKFLLLILNMESGGPEAILSQLGMGSKGKTVMPYDVEKQCYYEKIMAGMSMNDQLTVYIKSEEKTTKLVNKSDSELFVNTLSPFEQKNLLPGKFILLTPKVTDYTQQAYTTDMSPKTSIPAIESLYTNLIDLIVSQNLKYLFMIQGEEDEPDVVFIIDMTFDPTHASTNQIQFFDVFVDDSKQLRDQTFIKITEDLEITFLNEITDASYSEMFNSNFTIVIPVKSFDRL